MQLDQLRHIRHRTTQMPQRTVVAVQVALIVPLARNTRDAQPTVSDRQRPHSRQARRHARQLAGHTSHHLQLLIDSLVKLDESFVSTAARHCHPDVKGHARRSQRELEHSKAVLRLLEVLEQPKVCDQVLHLVLHEPLHIADTAQRRAHSKAASVHNRHFVLQTARCDGIIALAALVSTDEHLGLVPTDVEAALALEPSLKTREEVAHEMYPFTDETHIIDVARHSLATDRPTPQLFLRPLKRRLDSEHKVVRAKRITLPRMEVGRNLNAVRRKLSNACVVRQKKPPHETRAVLAKTRQHSSELKAVECVREVDDQLIAALIVRIPRLIGENCLVVLSRGHDADRLTARLNTDTVLDGHELVSLWAHLVTRQTLVSEPHQRIGYR